jgi:hypothetical protein
VRSAPVVRALLAAVSIALWVTASSSATSASDCQTVGKRVAATYLLCFHPNRDEHGTFFVRNAGTTKRIDVRAPGPTPSAAAAGRVGHWAWAALSPDGTTFVAQWSAECEVPIGFFVGIGEKPRPVTGEANWAKSPESTVYGWTTDGRAIVRISKSVCGLRGGPGVYAISPSGRSERLGDLTIRTSRSLTPRTVTSLLTQLKSGTHVAFHAGTLSPGDRISCVGHGIRVATRVPPLGTGSRGIADGRHGSLTLSLTTRASGTVVADCR